jgi:hypothetical protein
MKKYMKPTLTVVTIQPKQFINASDPAATINQNGSVNAGSVEAKEYDDFSESTGWSDGLW